MKLKAAEETVRENARAVQRAKEQEVQKAKLAVERNAIGKEEEIIREERVKVEEKRQEVQREESAQNQARKEDEQKYEEKAQQLRQTQKLEEHLHEVDPINQQDL